MISWSRLGALRRDVRGAAAAEMALIIPLLLSIMAGSFELGSYFWNQHIVVKGVRDGARYAARQSFAAYGCGSLDPNVETKVKNVTRTGKVTAGTSRITGWTDAHTSVSVSCSSLNTGIYDELPSGAPLVTVSAVRVPYPSLLGSLGLNTDALTLNARSQAAVAGA